MVQRRTRGRPALIGALLLLALVLIGATGAEATQTPYRGEPPERVESEFFEQRPAAAAPGGTGATGPLPFTGSELLVLIAVGAACITVGLLLYSRRDDVGPTEP